MISRNIFFILVNLFVFFIQVHSQNRRSNENTKRHKPAEWRHSRHEGRFATLFDRHQIKERKRKKQTRQMSEIIDLNDLNNLSDRNRPEEKMLSVPEFVSIHQTSPLMLNQLVSGIKTLSSMLSASYIGALTSTIFENTLSRANATQEQKFRSENDDDETTSDNAIAWLADEVLENFLPKKKFKIPTNMLSLGILDDNSIDTDFLKAYESKKQVLNQNAFENLDAILPCALLPVPYSVLFRAVQKFNQSSSFPSPQQLSSISGLSKNLEQSLSSLALINPSLLGLFRHFKNPETEPFLRALDRLMRSISLLHKTRKIDTASRFYSAIRLPIELKLAVSNAFLAFLDTAFPYDDGPSVSLHGKKTESKKLMEEVLAVLDEETEVQQSNKYPMEDDPSVSYSDLSLSLSCVLSNELQQHVKKSNAENNTKTAPEVPFENPHEQSRRQRIAQETVEKEVKHDESTDQQLKKNIPNSMEREGPIPTKNQRSASANVQPLNETIRVFVVSRRPSLKLSQAHEFDSWPNGFTPDQTNLYLVRLNTYPSKVPQHSDVNPRKLASKFNFNDGVFNGAFENSMIQEDNEKRVAKSATNSALRPTSGVSHLAELPILPVF